jgi:hypothetical protein
VPTPKVFELSSTLSKYAVFLFSWTFMATVLQLKLGSAIDKIYAEDGSIYLQQAIDLPFPHDFFIPYAGYTDIIARLLGNFVSLFPLQAYTRMILVTVSLVLTLTGYLIFLSSKEVIHSKVLRIVAALGLILLPIGSFESFGNITNLHFYLMTGCLFLLLGSKLPQDRFYTGCLFIVVSCLSTPLMIYYIPILLIHILVLRLNNIRFRFNSYHASLLIGLALQFLFVFAMAYGDRGSNSIQSLSKTVYLFFDRVIGSSLIPFWGYVSGSDLNNNLWNLLFRGMMAIIVFSIFIFMVVVNFRNQADRLVLPLSLILGMTFYWLTIGYFFAPEPRYAIFAGYLFLVAIILTIENSDKQTKKRWPTRLLISVIFLTWIGSFTPSSYRTTGPTITEQIANSIKICKSESTKFPLTLVPVNGKWELVLDCSFVS